MIFLVIIGQEIEIMTLFKLFELAVNMLEQTRAHIYKNIHSQFKGGKSYLTKTFYAGVSDALTSVIGIVKD